MDLIYAVFLRRFIFLCVVAHISVLTTAMAANGEIFDIRFGVNGQGQTRIVLDATAHFEYHIAPQQKQDARMLVVTLFGADFRIGTQRIKEGRGTGLGHIGGYQYTSAPDNMVHFHIKNTALPGSVVMLAPGDKTAHYRLVIDMIDADAQDFAQAVAAIPARQVAAAVRDKQVSAKDAQVPSVQALNQQTDTKVVQQIALDVVARSRRIARAEQALGVPTRNALPTPRVKPGLTDHQKRMRAARTRIIVIDAGHGGRDPGAIGQTGLQEKNVTLIAAKSLQSKLESQGHEVILTRESDEYIDLDTRAMMAREAGADLFLSIHADANPSPDLRGASVYTISQKGSDQLALEMSQEGDFQIFDTKISDHGSEIGEILFDLAHTDTKNQSARFAQILIESLSRSVPVVRNSHRHAGYRVLLSPDVPAVLLELAFISNLQDEKNLNSSAWRNKTLNSVMQGIETYFADHDGYRHAYRTTAPTIKITK